MRILVIDDDLEIRKLINKILVSYGHIVEMATNGKDGINIFRKNPFDLVITDIIMPQKEGLETIRELKQDFPEVKIIAISGRGKIDSSNHLEMAKVFGAKASLCKPFMPNELLNTIAMVMNKKPS